MTVPSVLVENRSERPSLKSSQSSNQTSSSMLYHRLLSISSICAEKGIEREQGQCTFPLLQWIKSGWFRVSSRTAMAATILSSGI